MAEPGTSRNPLRGSRSEPRLPRDDMEKRKPPSYSCGFRDGFLEGFQVGLEVTTDFRKWVMEQYVIFSGEKKRARERAEKGATS